MVGDDRLSFGSPDRLMAKLGLTPGSVSPFGLINNADGSVRVVIDADLKGKDRLIFHPNINTASIVVSWDDLEKFLRDAVNPVRRWTRIGGELVSFHRSSGFRSSGNLWFLFS